MKKPGGRFGSMSEKGGLSLERENKPAAEVALNGGKNYLARDIVSLMPRHLNYVEPYCGGCTVLFARDPDDRRLWLSPHKGVSEVVNDLNGRLMNFWRVLRDAKQFAEFYRMCEASPFSGVDWIYADSLLAGQLDGDSVEMAWAFFVANHQSLAGRMKGFTGITKTRTRARMNNEVSAWLSCIDGLPVVHDRLKKVLVLPPQPALRVIKKFDATETLFYLDPPYLHETRATITEYGDCEMSGEDHQKLLGTIKQCKSKVMLSGYASKLYDGALSEWNRYTFDLPNQASGARKKERKTEVLWCNF